MKSHFSTDLFCSGHHFHKSSLWCKLWNWLILIPKITGSNYLKNSQLKPIYKNTRISFRGIPIGQGFYSNFNTFAGFRCSIILVAFHELIYCYLTCNATRKCSQLMLQMRRMIRFLTQVLRFINTNFTNFILVYTGEGTSTLGHQRVPSTYVGVSGEEPRTQEKFSKGSTNNLQVVGNSQNFKQL